MRPFRNGNDTSHGRNYSTNEPLLQNELQNLDMELQILKRQREIIFKQRQVENQLLSRRLDTYNEPSSSFDSYSPGSSRGYKRPAEKSYVHPAKHSRPNAWDDKYKPKPQPLMSAPTQFKKAKPFPNKPKFEPRTSNPSFKPQKETPTPRTRTRTRTRVEAPPQKKTKEADVLRPGVTPSNSLNGRLELALGELLKRIKGSPQLDAVQRRQLNLYANRNVKAIIRQRIASVMMNKRVGHMVEIVAQYKKVYPKDVDNEIIEAIDTADSTAVVGKNLQIKNICAADSERICGFFKSKINLLLKNKVQNMIDNLFKMYGDNEEEILECLKDLPEIEDREETDAQNKDAAANIENVEGTEENNDKSAENTADDKAQNDNSAEKTEESNSAVTIDLTENEEAEKLAQIKENRRAKIQQYYKLMDLLIEQRLPKVLLNYKDEFAKILFCEKDFIVGKEMIMIELKENLRKYLYAANNINNEVTVVENQETNVNNLTESDVPARDTPEAMDIESNQNANKDVEMMDVESNQNKDQQVNKQNVKPPQNVQKGSQLYVMLLGKPSLPAKAVIYDFLHKFNPKSIKKHKTVNNLLVVGFESKDDYEKILEANESKVGDATFIIKANEVIASDKPKQQAADKDDSEINASSEKTEEINKATEERTATQEKVDEKPVDDVKDGQVEESQGEPEKMEEGTNKEVIDVYDETESNGKAEAIDDQINNDNNDVEDEFDQIEELLASDKDGELAGNDEDNNTELPDDEVGNDKELAEQKDDSGELVGDKEVNDGDLAGENVKNEEEVNSDNVEDASEDNKDSKVSSLETIQESEEEKAKPKTRVAVATPTRSSSRLANVTPSSIKTRRASRLAQ